MDILKIKGADGQWHTVPVLSTGASIDSIGEGLKLVEGDLSVDAADQAIPNNPKPITSGAVFALVGDIEQALAAL